MIEKTDIGNFGQLGQMMLHGLEEIIGLPGVNAVLDQVRLHRITDPSRKEEAFLELIDFAEIQSALEAVYGFRGGQGTALRAGRVSFYCILQQQDDGMGLNNPEFRFHPALYKINNGLRVLAEKFTELFQGCIYIYEDENAWIWQADCEPSSTLSRMVTTCNPFMLGVLQEFTQWATGGKHYMLYPVSCDSADVDTVQIRIEKHAIV